MTQGGGGGGQNSLSRIEPHKNNIKITFENGDDEIGMSDLKNARSGPNLVYTLQSTCP